jgi:uncharacterized protein YutE (UPF0331/DUF86 family)
MTDPDLVRKKLAFISRCVEELRTQARMDQIETDIREERFVVHSLQLAIQAALDVAFHIISDEALGEPRSNREAFALLARRGILESALATRLEHMAAFRNVIVHGYETVDLRIVHDVVEHRLDDLRGFVLEVEAFVAAAEAQGRS